MKLYKEASHQLETYSSYRMNLGTYFSLFDLGQKPSSLSILELVAMHAGTNLLAQAHWTVTP